MRSRRCVPGDHRPVLIAAWLIALALSMACSGRSGAEPSAASTAPAPAPVSSEAPPTSLPIAPASVSASTGATPDRPFGPRTRDSGCISHDGLPDSACTPGAILPNATADQVCQPGYSSAVRNVPAALSRDVYREYGIVERTPGEYEVDHLVSLELGGSNDVANLFPEAAEPRPGFHEKDQVENYLHDQVCTGRMSLFDAQRAIATNWLQVYQGLRQSRLPTAAPTNESVPEPQPAPAGGVVHIMSVSAAARGERATVTASTTPGASCSIVYRTPSGAQSTAQGLAARAADSAGVVSWTWSIAASTGPGTGSVLVTCDGASDGAPIQVG
jgi:hypothetical protein